MKNILLLTPLLASIVASQTILQYGSGQLPTCAETCSTLNTASGGCIPPAAPVSSQAIYVSCFCQSAFLTGLATDASTICDTTCTSQTDRNQIQSWYNTLCGTGSAAAVASSGTATATPSVVTIASTATTVTGVSAATSTLASSQAGVTNNNDQSSGSAWWHAHARWIAMAIVLVVGFTLIGVIGMVIKRRSTRKHQREAAMAPPVVWGPHQNQHYTGGTGYNSAPAAPMVGKGKGNAMSLPTSNNQPVNYSEKSGVPKQSKTGKLKKLMGRS